MPAKIKIGRKAVSVAIDRESTDELSKLIAGYFLLTLELEQKSLEEEGRMEEWGAVGEGLAGSIMPALVERQDAYHAFMTRMIQWDVSRRRTKFLFLWPWGTRSRGLGSAAAPTYLTGKGGLIQREAMSLCVSHPPSKGARRANRRSIFVSHKETSFKPARPNPQPRRNPEQPCRPWNDR